MTPYSFQPAQQPMCTARYNDKILNSVMCGLSNNVSCVTRDASRGYLLYKVLQCLQPSTVGNICLSYSISPVHSDSVSPMTSYRCIKSYPCAKLCYYKSLCQSCIVLKRCEHLGIYKLTDTKYQKLIWVIWWLWERSLLLVTCPHVSSNRHIATSHQQEGLFFLGAMTWFCNWRPALKLHMSHNELSALME